MAPFASGGVLHGGCGAGIRARPRGASSGDRADDRCIDRELGAVPQGQAVGEYLDATCITDRYIDVHVANPNIPGYLCSGLATDASNSMLQRKSSGGKQDGCGAGRAMVAELVQASVEGARARSTRQGESRRRSSSTRRCADGTTTAGDVGNAVKARAACESSSARDAGELRGAICGHVDVFLFMGDQEDAE